MKRNYTGLTVKELKTIWAELEKQTGGKIDPFIRGAYVIPRGGKLVFGYAFPIKVIAASHTHLTIEWLIDRPLKVKPLNGRIGRVTFRVRRDG